MKIRSKATTTKHLTLGILSTLSIATILGVGIYSATNMISTNNANALSYSTSSDVSFTFAPTLSIGLSTDSITIDNLVPGTTSDSNTVSVTVSSNTPYGYVLSAGVGSTLSTDPYYNTSDLVHDNSTTTVPTNNKFSSIATSASLPTLDTDNTWGYSTSTDGGTSWSTYSGLSNTETKPLLDISDPATPSTIDFKIAARSATTQASGAYNNVITFYAVGKPYTPPSIDDLTYLQDFAALSDADKQAMIDATPTEIAYTLKDKRDEQDYTIAKLKDGKIWMTKNLNLAGGTIITSELSDVPDGYTLPTANGFQSGNKLPDSNESFSDNAKAFVYNSSKITGINCSSPGCYSYYSWIAATAGSGLSIDTDNIDAPYSICPKGWKLPNTRFTDAPDWQSADFYQLAVAYGMDPGGIYQGTRDFYFQAGQGTIPNFLRAGEYDYYYFSGGGTYGHYWSSTSKSDTDARLFFFRVDLVDSGLIRTRNRGYAVRCITR